MTRKEPDEPHLLERELTGQIIGAFFECYNILRFGFLESAYRRLVPWSFDCVVTLVAKKAWPR